MRYPSGKGKQSVDEIVGNTNIERWRKIWTVTLFIGFEGKLREAASQ